MVPIFSDNIIERPKRHWFTFLYVSFISRVFWSHWEIIALVDISKEVAFVGRFQEEPGG